MFPVFSLPFFSQQPEQHLWSCDDKGNAYFLSSWEAGWRRLRAHRGVQLRVKQIVACAWCVWAIGVDQSPYLLVPFDGTTIRVTETIVQHEVGYCSSSSKSFFISALEPVIGLFRIKPHHQGSSRISTGWVQYL